VLENCSIIGYMLNMSATELMKEIQSLPEQERERIFEFVLRSQKPGWATPRPPGYFANCYDKDEIEQSNWFAARGPKAIVP
jgi:hypothetical protein